MDWLDSDHVETSNTRACNNRTSITRKRSGKHAFVTLKKAAFSVWSVPRLYNEVPRITESSKTDPLSRQRGRPHKDKTEIVKQ
jgi:hypothetical protein